MSARLLPRVRLGVMASVFVLILCALLLTPHGYDNRHTPDPDSRPSAAIDRIEATPQTTNSPELEPPATDPLTSFSVAPSPITLTTNVAQTTAESDGALDSSSPAVSEPAFDWLGANPLADHGILMPLPGCRDCDPVPGQSAGLFPSSISGGAAGSGGGGGTGGGGGAGQARSLGLTIPLTDSNPLIFSDNIVGGGDPGASAPPLDTKRPPDGPNVGNGGTPVQPIALIDPRPPDVAQVPEPTALVLTGAGALGFMIRVGLARKRRG